jgi:hypothetical protein
MTPRFFDFAVKEREAGGVVTENAQVFGERGLVGFGEFEQVDGAVEAGARVGGGAELHAQALERFHEGARLIMLAPVEERAETDGGVGLEIGGLVGGGNRGGASEGREAEGR